jgi:hypothetical protein
MMGNRVVSVRVLLEGLENENDKTLVRNKRNLTGKKGKIEWE